MKIGCKAAQRIGKEIPWRGRRSGGGKDPRVRMLELFGGKSRGRDDAWRLRSGVIRRVQGHG